jgi:ornithine cyclodeaminase
MSESELQFLDAVEVGRRLPWDSLIDAIERVVVEPGGEAPDRTVHSVPVPAAADASLLLKPAWVAGDVIAVKAVTFFPDNGRSGLATVNAGVLLFSASNGTLLGACDGNELTTRRTAAASAVAAKRLIRHDAARLLVVGTGALSPMVARAHSAVHDYDLIQVWGRNSDTAREVADGLAKHGLAALAIDDLDTALTSADVITCVTGATTPLIKGALVQAGTHVDLIGAFSPEMRESDDDLVRRATVFVDTRTDGIVAGDLGQPLADGIITLDAIEADLAELVGGIHPGRTSDDEITMFKSVGLALEDLAAARLVFDRG